MSSSAATLAGNAAWTVELVVLSAATASADGMKSFMADWLAGQVGMETGRRAGFEANWQVRVRMARAPSRHATRPSRLDGRRSETHKTEADGGERLRLLYSIRQT